MVDDDIMGPGESHILRVHDGWELLVHSLHCAPPAFAIGDSDIILTYQTAA